jgi:DNA-binding response OmpR family regulator
LLEADRHVVELAEDGQTAVELAEATAGIDAVILDVGLPDMSGLDVARRLRDEHGGLAILMLTARDTVGDRVRGLDAGADDYLVKPFDLPELVARLRALKRRAEGRLSESLTLGGLRLDLSHRELTFRGERVRVSPREMALTELLMHKAGRVVTKESIVAALSSWEADFSENSVEVYVHRLRKRYAALGVVIKTVRGFGYVMEAAGADEA